MEMCIKFQLQIDVFKGVKERKMPMSWCRSSAQLLGKSETWFFGYISERYDNL